MKLNIRNIVAAAIVAATGISASAQYSQSGYFLDGYTYGFQLNPAMGNDKNFVAMPGLGNINVSTDGNLDLRDVLYNVDGKTVLFLNPGVSNAEFLSNIKCHNKIGSDIKLGILAGGFKAWGGYNTIAINARANVGTRIPRALFQLIKEDITNKTYDIKDVTARATGYVEVALGHSRDVTNEWRVGATFKFLVGAGNADANLHDAQLVLGKDNWTITSDAIVRANMKGFRYKTKINENTGHPYVNDVDIDGAGIGGFGAAFDLGTVYKPAALPDWEFSAALLDLGFIRWKETYVASTNGPKTFVTDKYTFNVKDDAENSFDNEWQQIKDDVSALYELEDNGNEGGRTTALGATLNVGAKYTLPVYKALSFGLLSSSRIHGDYSWTDLRLSANIAPCKVFSATVNGSVGTYGFGFGWMANLHVTGFNLFLGMDHTPFKLAKQGAPLNSNVQLNLGMNFLF